MKRAAHFLLLPELAGSPPNEALINIFLENDLGVDVYSPDPGRIAVSYGDRVRYHVVEYGKRWILRSLISTSWRDYVAFSGTTEDPIFIVGLLSTIYRRPSVVLADEIRTGSYSGERGRQWKALCRWGMRRAKLTVVNDTSRIPLQQEYAGLEAGHPILVYPGCFRSPPQAGDRKELRRMRGIPQDAIVVCYSGVLNAGNGGTWIASFMKCCNDVYLLAQMPGLDPLVRALLVNTVGADRLYLEPKRLSWRRSWESMAAVDIGLVFYLQDGPQFRNMGTSSNRLCMFLSMGVPVVATRQDSFQFIEDYGAGILIETEEELPDAVAEISSNLRSMRRNATNCAREYIAADARYRSLVDAVIRYIL